MSGAAFAPDRGLWVFGNPDRTQTLAFDTLPKKNTQQLLFIASGQTNNE